MIHALFRNTCTLLFLLLLAATQSAEASGGTLDQTLVGVWVTVDASNEEGRRQGGIYFRTDGTGGFLAAKYSRQGNAGNPDKFSALMFERLLQSVGLPPEGTVDVGFKYSTEERIVTIEPATMMGMPVSGNPVKWLYSFLDSDLRLTKSDEPSIWILLEKVE